MRVVQVNIQPDYGGAERYTLLLADGLRARGHSVSLICHPKGRLRSEAEQLGLTTHTVTARNQADLRAAVHLAIQLRRERPDILHLQTSKEYFSGAIAARWARVPAVVVSRHMLLPVKPIVRRLFQKVDAVVVLSQAVRDNLLLYGVPDAKVNVIYAGIDTREFSRAAEDGSGCTARVALGVPDGNLLLGMAGRFVEGKGHACLLDAMASLIGQGVPTTLALVGEGPLRGEMEARARTLGIADQVIFAGFHPNLPAFMAALDVFVMASTCQEVMPLVLMEAMSAGCPVVATEVGGVSEIVASGRTGLLVPPGDAAALADALRRVGEDPSLRARLREAGHAEVLQRFTLSHKVEEMEQMYLRLLSRRP